MGVPFMCMSSAVMFELNLNSIRTSLKENVQIGKCQAILYIFLHKSTLFVANYGYIIQFIFIMVIV